MQATVTFVENPLAPMDRKVMVLRRPRRIRAFADPARPTVAILNGRPVLRAGWRRKLRAGDALVMLSLPAGGGGGGGSNPLRTIMMLAVMAFAPVAAGWILGVPGTAAGLAGTSALVGSWTVGQATALGLTMAGSALVNAMLPMRAPASIPGPSPTYSLAAQGNAARIGAPIPVQYGRILSWPDFAAQPYTEYAGEEAYLYQLFCLGAGDYAVEEIRIEDTPISAFAEIEVQVVPPGGSLTLFPAAVVTAPEISGQELMGRKTATYSQAGTVLTVTETAHGRTVGQAVQIEATSGGGPTGVYAIATVPSADSYTLTAATATASGACYIRTVLGGIDGIVASAAGSTATHLGIDLILPTGLYTPASGGRLSDNSVSVRVEARQVDDLGAPVGSWVTLATEVITDRTSNTLRKSIRYSLPAMGRYRVRAWRVDERSAETYGHQVLWAGLRAYLKDAGAYGAVTLIAMRARASGNLSLQASRRVSVIATRKLPVWTGSAWSAPVATRSIAWALADHARNATYGAGLPDARLDIPALVALDTLWTARGDSFDARFEEAGTWWEAAQRIARAGRAKVYQQGGILRVVRDGPAAIPVQQFGELNIVPESMVVDYVLETSQTADAVKVRYHDATVWTERSVTCALPGSAKARPADLMLFGVTGRDQATREGTYEAASNRYRRRVVKWATEMEGLIATIGDAVALQSDMLGWGQTATVTAWDAATRTLTLDEPMVWGAGTHRAGLRRPDGSLWGPVTATPGATASQIILASAPDFTPRSGSESVPTAAVFGPGDGWSAIAKIARVMPKSQSQVEIEALIEDGSVHTAETGVTAPPVVYSALPRALTKPIVAGLVALRVPGSATQAVFSWQPASDAQVYHLEMAEGDDPATAISWTRVADTSAAQIAAPILFAARTLVRVRGVGLAAGPWVTAAIGTLIADFWATDDTPFWLDDTTPFWSN